MHLVKLIYQTVNPHANFLNDVSQFVLNHKANDNENQLQIYYLDDTVFDVIILDYK